MDLSVGGEWRNGSKEIDGKILPVGRCEKESVLMKYKLVAADMDGTLLNSRGEITEATAEEIRKLAEKDVVFTISTGRPIQGVEKYKELLGLTGPIITYNGAMIVNAKDNKVLFEQGLLREDARKIWELGQKYNTTMCIWAGNQLYGNRLDEKIHDYKKLSGVEPVLAEDIEMLLDIGVTKILWYDEEEQIEVFLTQLSREMFCEVTYCTSKPTFLEFFNSKVSKAVAMEKIGGLLGITQEEMIAIGDGLNDLSMIQYAGLGVAMGNAAKEVKENAQFVTATNDDEGVKKVLAKFFT